MRCDGFLSKLIKLAITHVTFDRCVEPIGIERVKPGAKSRQLTRRQLLYGLLDVFGSCHSSKLTLKSHLEKQCNGVKGGLNPPAHRDQRAGHRAGSATGEKQDHVGEFLAGHPFGEIGFRHAGPVSGGIDG